MLRQSRLLLAVLLSLALFVTVTATIPGTRINANAAGTAVPPWQPNGSVMGFSTQYDYSNNQPGEYGIDVSLNSGTAIVAPESGWMQFHNCQACNYCWTPGNIVENLDRAPAAVRFGHVLALSQYGDGGWHHVNAGDQIGYVATNGCYGAHVEFMYNSSGNLSSQSNYLPQSPVYRPTPGCPVSPGGVPSGGRSFDPCYVLYSYMHSRVPYGPGRSVSLITRLSGYIATGSGQVIPFGGATITGNGSQPLWGIDYGRGVATCLGVDNYGYELDLYGGVHQLGTAPAVTTSAYWSGWDIARGLVLRTDCHSGYVLDGYGGLHPFTRVGDPQPPVPTLSAYWGGWDIARAVDFVGQINGVDSGYVLDGYGGVHQWGNAPATSGFAYWGGWDIARAIVPYLQGGVGAGYTLDGYGGVHDFGNAPFVKSHQTYWGVDVARGVTIANNSLTGYYVDTSGSLQTFTLY
jgi:hypothetical protein